MALNAPFRVRKGLLLDEEKQHALTMYLCQSCLSDLHPRPADTQVSLSIPCRHMNALSLHGSGHIPKPGALVPLLPLLMHPLLFLRKSFSLGFFRPAAFRGHS